MIPKLRQRIESLGPGRPLVWEAAFVSGLFLAGALLRMLLLDDIPPGLAGDEAWAGLDAQRAARDGWIGFWGLAWGQPEGPIYWTSLLFRFFPEDVLTLRISLAILGVLTIPVFYLLARELYGPRPAIIGTLLLTFSYWHIHYSRIAFMLVAAPLVVSLVLLFLAKGIKSGKSWALVAAGIVFGLGIYAYGGYAFFAVAIGLLWLFLLVRRRPFSQTARHLLLFVTPALLLAIPMLHLYFTDTERVTGYSELISIYNSQEFEQIQGLWDKVVFTAENIVRSISIYFLGRRPDYTDGFAAVPVLDQITMVLFGVGLAVSLWRWRQWQYFLIPVTVVSCSMAVAITTPDWGENRRGISALPMVYAAAAIGAEALLTLSQRLSSLVPRVRVQMLYPVMAAVVGFTAFLNVQHYFGDVALGDTMKFAFAYELGRASDYLDGLDGHPYVYFYSDRWSFNYEARRFQAPGLAGEDRSEEFGQFSLEVEPEHLPAVFLLLGSYQEYAEELQARYPDGEYTELREDGQFIFAAYRVW